MIGQIAWRNRITYSFIFEPYTHCNAFNPAYKLLMFSYCFLPSAEHAFYIWLVFCACACAVPQYFHITRGSPNEFHVQFLKFKTDFDVYYIAFYSLLDDAIGCHRNKQINLTSRSRVKN